MSVLTRAAARYFSTMTSPRTAPASEARPRVRRLPRPLQGNTSGPNGHTALTGREGTIEKNPVARAKSRETGEPLTSDKTTEHGHEKKGLMDKVKDALHK